MIDILKNSGRGFWPSKGKKSWRLRGAPLSIYPVVQLLDDELLELLEPEDVDEEPMCGQFPLYDVPDPLDVDDVVGFVLDCANAADPIARLATTTIAIIVTTNRLRLLGMKSPFVLLCELIDKILFHPLLLRNLNF
jgi:hypothetical protein